MTDTANAPERADDPMPCPLCSEPVSVDDWEDDSQTHDYVGIRCKCGLEMYREVHWSGNNQTELKAEVVSAWNRRTHRDELVAAARAEGALEAQAKIARLTMIANELSWSKKTRDISNRLFAALQENANE